MATTRRHKMLHHSFAQRPTSLTSSKNVDESDALLVGIEDGDELVPMLNSTDDDENDEMIFEALDDDLDLLEDQDDDSDLILDDEICSRIDDDHIEIIADDIQNVQDAAPLASVLDPEEYGPGSSCADVDLNATDDPVDDGPLLQLTNKIVLDHLALAQWDHVGQTMH